MKRLFIGYGERIITPFTGIELSGYGLYLKRQATSINDDLKVRALSISNKRERVILISCDLMGFDVQFSYEIREEISKELNVPISNILLSCIHTHTCPATMDLRGFGEINENYLRKLKLFIKECAKSSLDSESEGEIYAGFEIIEPIGFNRRNRSFHPIDPLLKVGIFKRKKEKIYLVSYACHPVILGKANFISADWPGCVIRKIEEDGNYGIFFQGFCGDIDPVTNLNRWGNGTLEDIEIYGELVKNRILKVEEYAAPVGLDIKCFEEKIFLPLVIPEKREIKLAKEKWEERINKVSSPGSKKFLDDWVSKATEKYEELKRNPYVGFLIHAISIGKLKIIGLSGEIFCEYDLNLRKNFTNLFTFGYTNGDVGYIPTGDAYKIKDDYACYVTPKAYPVLFPFSPEIESIILKKSKEMLEKIKI